VCAHYPEVLTELFIRVRILLCGNKLAQNLIFTAIALITSLEKGAGLVLGIK